MAEIEHKHNNFVADLDLTSALVNPQRCIMWAPFSDLIKAANGSVRVGVLATMIDVAWLGDCSCWGFQLQAAWHGKQGAFELPDGRWAVATA